MMNSRYSNLSLLGSPKLAYQQVIAQIAKRAAERQGKTLTQLIRGSLTEFARSQGFQPAAHHRLLIDELEAVERGDTDLLLIEMPPGSAKSTYVNYLFPAWVLARNPTWRILTASHATELAERWGRKTRNMVVAYSQMLGVSLSTDSQAAGRWATTQGGEYYAVGVGVGISGFRGDLGIIDDPFSLYEDAQNKKTRDKVWDWYLGDFQARLTPYARRVVMHQRFNEDDFAGRLVEHMKTIGRPMRRLKLRAESTGEDDDPLGRPAGVMLWDDPAGYNYGKFLRDRKRELAGDPRKWAALYQQEPIPESGTYFKAEWLIPVEKLPPRDTLRVYGGSDYAVTSGGGDFTVHAVVGLDPDGNPWLLDIWREQAASDEWVEAFCDLVIKWKPMGWAEENGQIKSGVGPFLEREMRARKAYVAREQFPTRGDKAVRAQSFRGLIAVRGLRILANATWRSDVEGELMRFPAGVHDDITDALGLVGQLLDKMLAGQKPPDPERKSNLGDYAAANVNDMGGFDLATM
jgi:predicted phage terminase large subunit-like protein